MKRNQKGFTLIELMIVIAIIGILASVALPAYREYIVTSKMAGVFASVGAIKKAFSTQISEKGEAWLETASNCNAGNCWGLQYGMRNSPDALSIEGINNIQILQSQNPNVQVDTCVGLPLLPIADGGVIISRKTIRLTFDGTIDGDILGNVDIVPMVNVARPTNINWIHRAMDNRLRTGADLGGVACRWMHDNLNERFH